HDARTRSDCSLGRSHVGHRRTDHRLRSDDQLGTEVFPMLNRIIWQLAAALGVSALLAGTAAAQSADRGCIELKTIAEISQSYVDDNGKSATRLVPIAKVVPGDQVVWTIVASNVCAKPAADVAITN